MANFIKNMAQGKVLALGAQVATLPGQIVSKTLAQNAHHSLTLFAFDKGEEISTHASDGDALVVALEGAGTITIDGTPHHIAAGDSIVMPAQKPHAVYAEEPFKMLLTVLFD